MTDLDKDLGTVLEVGINIVETTVEIEDSRLELFQEIEEADQNQNPGLDLAPMQVQIGIDLDVLDVSDCDHFARECPNTMTEDDSEQEDLESATLQMLSQDDSLNYAEMEGLNM